MALNKRLKRPMIFLENCNAEKTLFKVFSNRLSLGEQEYPHSQEHQVGFLELFHFMAHTYVQSWIKKAFTQQPSTPD